MLARAAVIVAKRKKRCVWRAACAASADMRAGLVLPMRGANVVRKRSVANPGNPAGAAVSGGLTGEGPVPPAGGSAAGGGPDAVGRRGGGAPVPGGRGAVASRGPQSVIGPSAPSGQTPEAAAQPLPEPLSAAGM